MNLKCYFEIADKTSPYNWFCYFDTQDNLAMILFRHNHIDVTIESVFGREDEPYRIVLCRIPRTQREGFLRTVFLIPAMMEYAGHTDYNDFCQELMQAALRVSLQRRRTGNAPVQ